MKRQLIFTAKDIFNNKLYFIWNSIQITVVCLLISFILQSVFEYKDVQEKFGQMTEYSEIYMFRDVTSDDKMDELLNDKDKLPLLTKLYHSLEQRVTDSSNRVRSFTADSGKWFYIADELKKSFHEYLDVTEEKMSSVDLISVSKNFFDIYNIEINGDLKKFCDGTGKQNSIPIMVGNDFRKLYKLHDTIRDYDDNSYEIVGFLEADSYYIAPGETKEPIYLDRSIIQLAKVNEKDSMELMNYFTTTYFITSDSAFMEEIQKQSRQQELMDLRINNFSYQMNAISSDLQDQIVLNGSLLVLLFAFCLIAMTGNVLQFISNYKREFAINRMCGASKNSIIFRILIQIWCMFFIAAIAVIVMAGISKSVVESLVFGAVYIMLVGTIPIWILNRQTIQTMLKKSYE